jgi:hypothetical protein
MQRNRSRWNGKWQLGCLALLICANGLRADTILDLTFDNPQGLIGEAGITAVGPEFAKSTATIASGAGGRALPQISGKPQEASLEGAKFQITSKPEMGVPGFLRISVGTDPGIKSAGVGIIPAAAENTLSAMAQEKDGAIVFDGAFDFFFRVNGERVDAPPKFSIWSKTGPLTIAIEPGAAGAGLSARITSTGAKIETRGGQPRASVGTRLVENVPIEFGEVYHAAIVFRTDAEGWTSLQIFLKKGTGPISLADGDGLNAAIEAFKVAGPLGGGEASGKISLNVSRIELAQHFDLAELRIFKPHPGTIPAAGK